MKRNYKFSLIPLLTFFLSGCATMQMQVDQSKIVQYPTDKELLHSFYLLGDAGNSKLGETDLAIQDFEKALNNAAKNSTAIFLGDNIYPNGFTTKDKEKEELAKHRIKVQTDAAKNFKGNTIFIPGNHDWYSGLKGLKKQEKFIEDALGKNTFLPENGCPIEKVKISEDVILLVVDSHWYITNWDNKPTINDNCEIKTRIDFLDEIASEIKKARGKTTLIAMHHPMFNNGAHGGQYSFKSHVKPFPIAGTLKNIARKTGGVIDVDLQNKMYNELQKRVTSLAQQNDKVIFVSGHEHNLQYLVEAGLPQIISGSGSKVNAARLIGNGQFAYGANGYARLDVFKDGSSFVLFYEAGKEEAVFQTVVLKANQELNLANYPDDFPNEKVASIYTKEEVDKSGFYKFLWGDRYRKQFGTKVKAPTVSLDTLFGGVKPVRKGGGNQSKSLRLEDNQGRQYVMRALKKQASQYLQALIYKDEYIGDKLDDNFASELLLDVFTGAHPYAPFLIGDLSDAIGVYHTNPVLYYVPKQKTLGSFNSDFGDELYMIEEHTSEGHDDKASFGYSNTLLSTTDMMKKIHKDEDIIIDEVAYIKARLFDMLIGDWDRHQDQWRWIEFKENGKKVYRPMPRDRDQAFSKMSDGFLLTTAVKLIPAAGLLREYNEDLVDVKGINVEPYPLDMELIENSVKSVWDEQVAYIQKNITDEVIEKAFLNMPVEIRDADAEEIKRLLKARRENLQKISDRYYRLVNKFSVITGTNKDDWFDIERMPEGVTKVTAYRIKDGKKSDVFHERVYNRDETKEIWIYALDDDDVFNVFGEGNRYINVRLIGGQNNDTYDIKNGKKIKFYDYKSKKNTIVTDKGSKKLTDDYETNVYDYKKLKNSTLQTLPSIGANPDDGFKIGFVSTLTNYTFERNPFSSQHSVSAGYFFATNGFDLGYRGEFANVIGEANLKIESKFTSPNFARNFFGFGNSTPNLEPDNNSIDLDFNRVKIRTFDISPALVWRGQYGSTFEVGASYESNEVERTSGRYLETITAPTDAVFDKQDFYGAHAKYIYDVRDNSVFPTLGMMFGLEAGFKNNVSTSKGFGYVIPELGFDYKITNQGTVVLATKLRSQINLGDDFEFYQAATLGDSEGLRGYRRERFSGKQSFVQSTDLRFNLRRKSSNFLPFNVGFYGGFDYGRIWIDDGRVLNPMFNESGWNTSVGGGIFVSAYSMFTANVSAFSSDDGLRLAFKLGFGF
ncbi:phosphoesterase [Winogradskyella sp. PC-19]|uniref:metallophosphoesterase n=1 Tax=unclassified Winogradskyella TaxID=2615021 RepID=UPI000B3CEA7E|nr:MULTISPECIES: metallophosphoesterase [unclassified Winogradskyella]ARV10088.1 phosphoesterase [Winogradskyella sp. PC-19]RZN79969.1 MAG: phosphoesterase [Winogradskyella sp.]